jgi:hypothetical protein
MAGVKRIAVCIASGAAAVCATMGVFWLGVHCPEWLGALIPLSAVFLAGALVAYNMMERR